MKAFFIGLQFLTRIHLVSQTVWTEEDFGKSVRYFPLVGAVLGMIYGGTAFIMFNLLPHFGVFTPHYFGVAILLAMTVILTGGIHCDGFMDTVDGIFSGRPRDRMLEYKAMPHGCRIVRVPTFYPSSQTCCNCGYQNRNIKNLGIRKWECPECGQHHDRDTNAAKNILAKAKEIIAEQA